MGVSIRSAKSHVPICEGVPAAVAVVDESGTVRFATRGFVDRFELREDALIDCPREVEEVAGARADRKTASLDGLEASLVAVTDGDGRRMAALTIPAIPGEGPAERTSPVLDEPLDESPAIIWLKDLDGRYLRINSRYAKQLQTDPDDVCGRTDAELTAASSIEGMRLEEKDIVGGEPLELEYLIGAFEDRPAFAALRFALRDGDGEPTATCSVAAPIADAALARSECDRLMRIDRWARLDAIAIRQELLDEWGLAVADGSSGPPLDRDDRVAAALVERDDAIATIERIEAELEREREQRDGLRSESELAARRAEELDGAVAAEQARSDEFKHSLTRAEARVEELEAELSSLQEELEQHRQAQATLADAPAEPEGNAIRWNVRSQRALSAALVGRNEWRSVLNHAIGTLGAEGGWDATVAWCVDKPRRAMRCGAFWRRDSAALAGFETRAWQFVEDAATGEFGRARNRMATACLLNLQSAEDKLLRDAAGEGIGSALLVPVSDGGETIAMLELLARTDTAPSPDVMISLEAIALQLGAIAQLLSLADVPRWRTGRV